MIFGLLVFGFLFFVAIVLLIPDSLILQLLYTFSSEESSNNIRTEQASFLIREFSLFGSGLGSSLESGYSRDSTGYGFELTYLNIIHKLGVFSMALFLYYLSTIILIVYRILHRKYLISSYFCFKGIDDKQFGVYNFHNEKLIKILNYKDVDQSYKF